MIGVKWGSLGTSPRSVRRVCRECGDGVSVSNREFKTRTDLAFLCLDCARVRCPDAVVQVATGTLADLRRIGFGWDVVAQINAMSGRATVLDMAGDGPTPPEWLKPPR